MIDCLTDGMIYSIDLHVNSHLHNFSVCVTCHIILGYLLKQHKYNNSNKFHAIPEQMKL